MNNRIKEILGTETAGAAPKFLAVASGKGGVGKSIISYNLAQSLSELVKVLVIDGDFQMGNLHLLANQSPQYGWYDVCQGEATLEEAVIAVPEGPDLLPANGLKSQGTFPELQKLALSLNTFRSLLTRYECIIVDTPSGLLPHSNVILNAVDEVLLVTTPELTSISDAYALYKILWGNNPDLAVSLLVNREDRTEEVEYIYQKFCAITRQYLTTEPTFFGWLSQDEAVVEAVANQRSVSLQVPGSTIAAQFSMLAGNLAAGRFSKTFDRKPLSSTPVVADIKE